MQITPLAPLARPLTSPAAPAAGAPTPPASRIAQELARAAAQLPVGDTTEVPSPDAPEDVRSGFMRYAKWAKTLRSIPGVSSSGWRSLSPDQVIVYTDGPGWTRLFRNVTDESVDGMTWVVREGADDAGMGTPPGVTPFWDRLQVQLNAVSALPGVSDWVIDGAMAPGEPGTFIRFTVTDAERGAQLADFVRGELHGLPVRFRVG